MIVERPKHVCLRFRLSHLMIAVAVCGVLFAIWPHFETRPSPLENLPQVKLGMSENEVEALIGKSVAVKIGGGVQRASHAYWDGNHTAVFVFWSGEGVTEVRLDGKLISPPRSPNWHWANEIREQAKRAEQRQCEVAPPASP